MAGLLIQHTLLQQIHQTALFQHLGQNRFFQLFQQHAFHAANFACNLVDGIFQHGIDRGFIPLQPVHHPFHHQRNLLLQKWGQLFQ